MKDGIRRNQEINKQLIKISMADKKRQKAFEDIKTFIRQNFSYNGFADYKRRIEL